MAKRKNLKTVTAEGDLLEALKTLALNLADELEGENRGNANLARQYRETMKDIAELEGGESDGDEIGELLERRAERRADTDEKDRTGKR